MSNDLKDRSTFIDGLELRALPAALSFSTTDRGAVASASAVSFVGNVVGQMKEDVLNSTLLAQLAANAQHDPKKEPKLWFDAYSNVLQNIGWNVPSFQFAHIDNAAASESVDKLVVLLAAQFLTGEGLEAFKALISAMGDTRNSQAVQIFNTRSSSEKIATFQLGTVTNSSGNAQFKVSTYSYETSSRITNVLFFNFSTGSVNFNAGNLTMVLNESVYSAIRGAVLQKLGGNAQSFIAGLIL